MVTHVERISSAYSRTETPAGTPQDQRQRGEEFARLHEAESMLVMANPWDVDSARLFAHLGFRALASTGGGFAFFSGLPDGSTSRRQQMSYLASISSATGLPVTADLEDGFGAEPADVHGTIIDAAGAGVVGGSIEDRRYGTDGTRRMSEEPFDIAHACARIEAAVEAAESLDHRFVVTARCENLIAGRHDLTDTITRLQAYQEAGAHCLYAPGLVSLDDVRTVVANVDRPLNVVVGLSDDPVRLSDLADAGVGRVTVGSAFARVALAAVERAAAELLVEGTSSFAARAMPHSAACEVFEGSADARTR